MDIAVGPRRRSKTSLPALVAATRGNCIVRVRLPYRRFRDRPAAEGRCVFSLVDYQGTEIRCRWPTGCAKRSRLDGGTGGGWCGWTGQSRCGPRGPSRPVPLLRRAQCAQMHTRLCSSADERRGSGQVPPRSGFPPCGIAYRPTRWARSAVAPAHRPERTRLRPDCRPPQGRLWDNDQTLREIEI